MAAPALGRRLPARTGAASARLVIAVAALALLAREPALHPHPGLAAIGFGVIAVCALVQVATIVAFADLGGRVMRIEELVAALAGVLVNGFGDERVTVLTLLWLVAIITGAIARGRVGGLAAAIFLVAMGLPIAIVGSLQASYVGLCVAAAVLLLTGPAMSAELGGLLELARYEADHDGLTGALARLAFRSALDEALTGSDAEHPLALVMLHLDRLGLVNKLHGHAAGDLLLVDVVNQMRQLGDARSIIGRLGGGEFAVTVRGRPEAFAEHLLDRLRDNGTGAPSVAGSIGIAWAPRDGNDANALLRAGDVALRIAKRSTHHSVATYSGDSLTRDGQNDAEAILARLIGGEGIEMVTQPIVDRSTGEVHAYEALARFHLGSTTSPLHWFSLAAEFGEREALEQACLAAAVRLLSDVPAGARLCVNLSGDTLPDARTLAILDTPADLSRLVLEITEDTLVRNDDPTLNAAIAILRQRGTRLAVDDMGAGYAGLRQITAVHPDYLKLDRSLISGIEGDPDRAALVKAMVDFAENVGALLVAEGIETHAELDALAGLGVHLLQGFLLARPAPGWPLAGAPPALLGRTPRARRAA